LFLGESLVTVSAQNSAACIYVNNHFQSGFPPEKPVKQPNAQIIRCPMEAFLLVIHLIVAIGIIVVVLVQPAESGGFLGNSGSMSNAMNPRRSGDALTKATGILAACFFVTSLLLAVHASMRPAQKGILDIAGDTPAVTSEQKPVAAETAADESETTPAEAANAPATSAPATTVPKAPIAK
jgi:preprotein translocase subunit SecG